MSACPGSTADGCRCPEHDEGLRAYARDKPAFDRALGRLRPVLHVVTMPKDDDPCYGGMTCPCQRCARERVRERKHPKRQPWEPRPARRAA